REVDVSTPTVPFAAVNMAGGQGQVKRLAHVCIMAEDLGRTEEFWVGALGLEVAFRFTRGGTVIGFYLAAGERTFIEVFQQVAIPTPHFRPIDHLCLEVGSLDAAICRLRAHDVVVSDKKLGIDKTWQAWTADPNGVKVELFEYTEHS